MLISQGQQHWSFTMKIGSWGGTFDSASSHQLAIISTPVTRTFHFAPLSSPLQLSSALPASCSCTSLSLSFSKFSFLTASTSPNYNNLTATAARCSLNIACNFLRTFLMRRFLYLKSYSRTWGLNEVVKNFTLTKAHVKLTMFGEGPLELSDPLRCKLVHKSACFSHEQCRMYTVSATSLLVGQMK